MVKGLRNFAGVLISLIILLVSCQKQDTLIGKNLIPGSQYLNGIYTDTVTLRTTTVREAPLITEFNPQFVLGSMNDRVFGHSYAGIYTQVLMPGAYGGYKDGVSDTAYVDSLVLNLNLTGYYGDTNATHNIRVYRLLDSMSILTTYQSNNAFRLYPSPIGERLNYRLGSRTINSSFTDVDGLNLGSSLRIRLNPTLGQDILNQSSVGTFADNENFIQYFKGLYIDEDTTLGFSNSMIYINLQGGNSMLEVYYHTLYDITHPGTASPAPLRFFTNSGALNTNYFNHNYQNKITKTALVNANKNADSVVYVQSMAGLRTYIQIPYLSNLGNVLINQAQIQVTMAQSDFADSAIYTAPAAMEVLVDDTTGGEEEAPDQGFSGGLPTYGGTKSYFTNPTTGIKYVQYTFSIAGQLQLMLNNKYINNGFYLVTSPSNEIADRIILGGGSRNGDPYQMRLNLVYTKIP